MKRLIVLGLVCAFSFCLHAQVVDTTVCDILKDPASFNGKIVRIKGTVTSDFDQFVVKGPGCGQKVNGIWLSYPEGSKAKSGPAAMVELQPAQNFTGTIAPVTRTPVTLEKSKDFKQFDSALATPYKNGGMCLGCSKYEVSATLVGRLDGTVAKLGRDKDGKIVSISGFGNLNEYSARLVLQSVSDVTPKEVDFSKIAAITKADTAPEPASGATTPDPVETAHKAAAAYGATSDAGRQLGRAADAFAKPNEKNGVTIASGNLSEAAAKDEEKGKSDSPDGVLFNVVYNSNRLSGEALARAVAHMGEHVADLRNPVKGNEDDGPYEWEFRAWSITVMNSLAYGQKTLTLPGGYLLWNAAWPAADRTSSLDSAVKSYLGNEELMSR